MSVNVKIEFQFSLFNYSLNQAKVETLVTDKFALGWCGKDEEVKALTLKASGAGESFFYFFSENM